MKQCAVVLNGSDVIKVSNLKRKYNKILNNPEMKILEECDLDMLEEKYNYWKRTLNPVKEDESNGILKYHYRNKKTGETISSIYPDLSNLWAFIDEKDYERID